LGVNRRPTQRCFTKENKPRGIVFVRFAALAVDSRAIKEFVAADEKQLCPVFAAGFEIPRDVSGVA